MSGTTPSPSPERTRLAAALRELKARTGLSLAGLAERTAYSKSSWDRYLGGKALPPRQAVQDLCRLAREPDGRCLALWEIAESEWSGRATETRMSTSTGTGTGTPPSPGPSPGPSPQEDTRTGGKGAVAVTVLASVCAVAVGSVAVALFLWPRQDTEPQSSVSPSPSPSSSATGPRCRGAACEGQNPLHMHCGADPATFAEHHTTTGARWELRYSKGCGASWARMWGTRVGDRLEMTAGGPTRSAEVEDDIDAEAYVYTPMAATRPGTVVRACFHPATDGKRECFNSRVG